MPSGASMTMKSRIRAAATVVSAAALLMSSITVAPAGAASASAVAGEGLGPPAGADDHLGVQSARRSGERRTGPAADLGAATRQRPAAGHGQRQIRHRGLPRPGRRQPARTGDRAAHRSQPDRGQDRSQPRPPGRHRPPDHRTGVLRAGPAAVLLRDHRLRPRPRCAAAVQRTDPGELPVPDHRGRVRRADRSAEPARRRRHRNGGRPLGSVHRPAGDRHHRPRRLPGGRAVRRPVPVAVPARDELEPQARLHLRRRLQQRLPPGRRAPAGWSTTCSSPRATRSRRPA